MIEMRENRYDDIRKDVVNRSENPDSEKSEKKEKTVPGSPAQQGKVPQQSDDGYKDEQYDPWS